MPSSTLLATLLSLKAQVILFAYHLPTQRLPPRPVYMAPDMQPVETYRQQLAHLGNFHLRRRCECDRTSPNSNKRNVLMHCVSKIHGFQFTEFFPPLPCTPHICI